MTGSALPFWSEKIAQRASEKDGDSRGVSHRQMTTKYEV